MEAQAILMALRQRGATVRALEGGRVEVNPRRVLDDDLRQAIRSHKSELLAELATREQIGAMLIRSNRFGREVWIALAGDVAAKLYVEESGRPDPRPVLLPTDLDWLASKSTRAARAALAVIAAFPGADVLQ